MPLIGKEVFVEVLKFLHELNMIWLIRNEASAF